MTAELTSREVPSRPALTPGLSAAEFRRWYYLRTELVDFARQLSVSTSGGKEALADRIAHALAGEPAPAPHTAARTGGPQLQAPLTRASVIPAGQRCSQVLRDFLTREVGPSFRFDAAMRGFVADGAGRTLGEVVDHWYATRDLPPGPIGPQFELNRFTRAWSRTHPAGTRAELRVAWLAYRNAPEDRRGPA